VFKVQLLGSDPELILLDKTSDKPKSAIGLYHHKDGVKIYSDNVLAEFSHSPLAPEDFNDGMNAVMHTVADVIDSFGCYYKVGQAEALYPKDQLCTPEAHAIGCSPFQNAYELGVNRTPTPYVNNYRFAGGHIHIAYDLNTLPPHLLVQLLDNELLPLDPNYGNTQRSDFYGAKGSFRYKPYGVEYRATSNWWLNEPQLIVDVVKDIETYVNKTYYGG